MNSLIQEVQSTAVELVGGAIRFLPGILLAFIVLLSTRFVANFASSVSGRLASKAFQSRSLQSLVMRASYVSAWAVGILIASVLAFPDLRLGDLVALLGLGSVAIGFAFQEEFESGSTKGRKALPRGTPKTKLNGIFCYLCLILFSIPSIL